MKPVVYTALLRGDVLIKLTDRNADTRENKILHLVERQQHLANAKVIEYEARLREMSDEKIDAEYRREFKR